MDYFNIVEMVSAYKELQAEIVEAADQHAAVIEDLTTHGGSLSSEAAYKHEKRKIVRVVLLHEMLVILSMAIEKGHLLIPEEDYMELIELYEEVIPSPEEHFQELINLATVEHEMGRHYVTDAESQELMSVDGEEDDEDDEEEDLFYLDAAPGA